MQGHWRGRLNCWLWMQLYIAVIMKIKWQCTVAEGFTKEIMRRITRANNPNKRSVWFKCRVLIHSSTYHLLFCTLVTSTSFGFFQHWQMKRCLGDCWLSPGSIIFSLDINGPQMGNPDVLDYPWPLLLRHHQAKHLYTRNISPAIVVFTHYSRNCRNTLESNSLSK